MKPRLNPGGPSPKAKYSSVTDSELVPRGKGEKEPRKGSEKYLKLCAYKVWEPCASGVTACLLHNELTSCVYAARLSHQGDGAEAKASVNNAI